MRKHTLKKAVAVFVTAFILITTILAVNISAKEYTISGKWKWNNPLEFYYDDEYYFEQTFVNGFTCANGETFNRITFNSGGGFCYDDKEIAVPAERGWGDAWGEENEYHPDNKVYQIIEFNGVETVSEKFYNIITRFAEQIGGGAELPRENHVLNIFTGFIKDFGLSIKAAFNNFVFDDGTPSAEFEVLLCYLVIIIAISVFVAVINMILKRRKNKL